MSKQHYEAALPLLLEVREIRQRALGPDAAQLSPAWTTLAELAYAMGDDQEALAAYERSTHIARTTLGPTHPQTLGVEVWQAEQLVHLGRPSEALALLAPMAEPLERQPRPTLMPSRRSLPEPTRTRRGRYGFAMLPRR